LFERLGIVCRQILAIVHLLDESMVDVRWRGALGFYFIKPMYARVTSVIMQALESSLKKVKALIPPQALCYPVLNYGAKDCYFSFYQTRSRKEISQQVQVFTPPAQSDII
jgi:hypothetical protein